MTDLSPGDPLKPRTPDGEAQPGPPPPPEPDAPPTEPSPRPRRLTRSSTDRVFGGVAGGLGRHFDVDPVVFRIGFAALSLLGGFGVFAYLLALLFVPDDTGASAPFDRSRALTVVGAAVLAIAALAALDSGGIFWGPLIPLAFLGGVGYLVYRLVRRGHSDGPVTVGRVVVWLTIGVGAVLAAGALAFGSAWAAAEGGGAVVAGLVIAIGALLIVSAVRDGGARWLVVPALVIAIPLGVVAAADVSFDGGFGERDYRPATVADLPVDGYELGAGELNVDLRDVDFPRDRETVVDLRLGMGGAEVLVPSGVCVLSDARFGGGYVDVRGRDSGGLDLEHVVRGTSAGAPRVLVRSRIGLGALRIADEPSGYHGPRDGFDGFDGRDGFRPGGDADLDDGACDRVEIASAG